MIRHYISNPCIVTVITNDKWYSKYFAYSTQTTWHYSSSQKMDKNNKKCVSIYVLLYYHSFVLKFLFISSNKQRWGVIILFVYYFYYHLCGYLWRMILKSKTITWKTFSFLCISSCWLATCPADFIPLFQRLYAEEIHAYWSRAVRIDKSFKIRLALYQ